MLLKKNTKRDDFLKRLRNKFGDTHSMTGEFVNMSTKTEFIHNECGHKWMIAPRFILRLKKGCPRCYGTVTKTPEEYREQVMSIKGPDYEVLSDYVNAKSKVHVRHICGYEYMVLPNNLLKRNCANCSDLIRKDTEYYKNEVSNLVGEEYSVLSEYINAKTHIKMRHNSDNCNNNEYEVVPDAFLRGNRCPRCIESLGEKKIRECLDRFRVDYIEEYRIDDCRNIKPLPFDFAIFKNGSLLCLIEYDGRQHFNESDWFGGKDNFLSVRKNDGIKNSYCKENHIDLIRIPYWEYENIESILDEQGVLDIKETMI